MASLPSRRVLDREPGASSKIGVLALQGDFAEHIDVLQRLGAEAVAVRLPEQLEGLDGLIIPGGESTTIARLLHEWALLEPIRHRFHDGMAIWGTCAGAILLAERAPGLDREGLRLMDIGVERNAFGRQVDSFEADLDVPALGEPPYRAVFIRAPLIVEAGPNVEVLARLTDGTIVAAQQGALLATAFHPELTDDIRFHRYFLELVAHGRRDETQERTAPIAS
jgi:5'-phosphate synthase pdxT subunit